MDQDGDLAALCFFIWRGEIEFWEINLLEDSLLWYHVEIQTLIYVVQQRAYVHGKFYPFLSYSM